MDKLGPVLNLAETEWIYLWDNFKAVNLIKIWDIEHAMQSTSNTDVYVKDAHNQEKITSSIAKF